MTDRIRITHQNVASITTREKQHFFLKSAGVENEILNSFIVLIAYKDTQQYYNEIIIMLILIET